ncbi:MAG: hypothetical protein AAFQ94_20105, partial [Bacteroidota bacterium]
MNTLFKYILIFLIVANAAQSVPIIAQVKNQVDILLDSSQRFLSKDPQKSQQYLQLIQQQLTVDDSVLQIKVFNNYGVSYYFKGAFDSSVYFYRQALDL